MRKTLPQRRKAETFKLRLQDLRGSFHITCGYYDDGTIGEIFINSPKVGTPVAAIVNACAVLVSIGLQHGAPLEVLADALPKEVDGTQSTLIGLVLDAIKERGLDVYKDRPPAHVIIGPLTKEQRAAIIEEVAKTLAPIDGLSTS